MREVIQRDSADQHDSFMLNQQYRITEDHPYFSVIRKGWGEGLLSIFAQLPPLELKE
jgi:putative proteasome-type protease